MLRFASYGAASAFRRQGRGNMLRAEHRALPAPRSFSSIGDEGGFTGWLAARLPRLPQSSAYQAIEIFNGVSEEMFLNFGNIRPGALAEIAKAEPDIQALIAERVEAGEIFTAAKVEPATSFRQTIASVPHELSAQSNLAHEAEGLRGGGPWVPHRQQHLWYLLRLH